MPEDLAYCGVTGTHVINYTIETPTSSRTLTSEIPLNTALTVASSAATSQWTKLPSRDEMTSVLVAQFPAFKPQAVDFMVSDAIRISDTKYQLSIYPKSDCTYYTDITSVVFYLKDTRKLFSDVITKVGTSASNRIILYNAQVQSNLDSYFVFQRTIEIICAANDIDIATFPMDSYTIAFSDTTFAADKTFTMTITPYATSLYYLPTAMTLYGIYKVPQSWSMTMNDLTKLDYSEYGWSITGCNDLNKTILFARINPYSNKVGIYDSYITMNGASDSRFEIGHHVNLSNTKYELSAILGAYDLPVTVFPNALNDFGAFYYGGSYTKGSYKLTGTLVLPYTLSYLGKNAMRAQSFTDFLWANRGSDYYDDDYPFSSAVYSDAFYGITTVSNYRVPSRVTELPREWMGNQSGSSLYLFNSSFKYEFFKKNDAKRDNGVIAGSTDNLKLYVTENLYPFYKNDNSWKAKCPTINYIPYVSHDLPKQVDATSLQEITPQTMEQLIVSQATTNFKDHYKDGNYQFVLNKNNKTVTVRIKDNRWFYGEFTVSYL